MVDWTISSEKYAVELVDQLSRCAYSVGQVLGDGHIQSYRVQKKGKWYPLQMVRIGTEDRDALERVRDEVEAVFGPKYAIMDYRVLKSGKVFYQVHLYRRDIFDFFAINTAMKTKIPDMYFSAPDAVKKELIAGLLDSDGYVSHRKFANHEQWIVGFANTKRELVEGMAALLKSLGVKVGKIGETTKGEYRVVYRIAPNIRSFVEAGCYFRVARKAKKLNDCLDYMLGSETMYAAPSS